MSASVSSSVSVEARALVSKTFKICDAKSAPLSSKKGENKKADFLSDLETKGYAVVHAVLNEDECAELANGFWQYWENLTGGHIRKDDPKSWRQMFEYFPMHGMLCQHFSIGHMPEIWQARCNENVLRIYQQIWGTSDLTVSFDGASTGFAPEETNRGWHTKDWLHLDQSLHRNEFECVQGWVTANDVGTGDGTLSVLEGSHLLHKAFAKAFGLNKDKACRADWYKLEQKHVDWYLAQGCKQVAIECPKGSMVLWESRTVHAGRGPLRGRAEPRNRMVAYISMMPNAMLTSKDREKKKKACLEGRLTSHWAAKHVKLFPKWPRTYGKKIPEFPEFQPPYLSETGARLAGWVDPAECPLTIEDPETRRVACLEALEQIEDTKRANMKRKRSAN